MSEAYSIVRTFEAAVARHVGAKHGVAVDNCTNAIFLALRHLGVSHFRVSCPAQTFISVPMAAMHAGARRIYFSDVQWVGQYALHVPGQPPVWDSAGQLAKGSYRGGLMCVSFQYRKPLPIGKGGMVLTDDAAAAEHIRRMRYLGRDESAPFDFSRVTELGWNMTMTPEQAARGLTLLELSPPTKVFMWEDYNDLRKCPLWRKD